MFKSIFKKAANIWNKAISNSPLKVFGVGFVAAVLMAAVFPPLVPLIMGATIVSFGGSLAKKTVNTGINLAEGSKENEIYKKPEASVQKEMQQDLSLQEKVEVLMDNKRYRRTMGDRLTPKEKKELNRIIKKGTKSLNKELAKANLSDYRIQKFLDGIEAYSEQKQAEALNKRNDKFLNASNKLNPIRPENTQRNKRMREPLITVETSRRVRQRR